MHLETDIVYVIDPNETARDRLTTLLGMFAVPVLSDVDAETFLQSTSLQSTSCGCLLVEEKLSGMGSLEFLRRLRDQGVDPLIVILASTSNRDTADQAYGRTPRMSSTNRWLMACC